MLGKTFLMLRKAAPDPIPVAGLLELVQTLSQYPNNDLARQIWEYLKANYASTFGDLDVVLKQLLRIFAQSNKELAGQVMDILAPRASEHEVALGMMQTLNKFQQYEQSLEIGRRVKRVTREIQGAIAVALLGVGDGHAKANGGAVPSPTAVLDPPLNAQELASVVRIKAQQSLECAVQHLDAFDAPDRHKRRAIVAIIDRAIERGDKLYHPLMARYRSIPGHSRGMAMNLEVKWHLKHGDFDSARTAFQLAATDKRTTGHHRLIGHKMLKSTAADASQRQWLEAVAKSLLYTR